MLSAARSKLHRHEDAVRVVHIIAERFAIGEATSRVELRSRLKSKPWEPTQVTATSAAAF